ncbi:MAG: PKD domain-containing protein, partial [Thermoplasmatota archaeon]
DFASGVTYYHNTRLSKGNHTYYYVAYNDHGSLRTPGLGEYYKITVLDPPVLHAPTLMNVSYYPISGNSSTIFSFSARYLDLDGDAPGSVQVVIDGTPYDMTVDGTDYLNGTTCSHSTKLSVGNHTIYFFANDTTGREVRVPQTGSYNLKVEEETGPPPVKHAPLAMISYSISGMNVTLNGSASYDTDGTISTYMWIVAGEPYTGNTIKVSFSSSGYYKALLTVVDNDGLSDTETVKFWIYPTTSSIPTPSSDVGGSMVVDKDGKGTLVDNETGFSLKLDSVGNNTVSFKVDSDSSGSKMVVLDVSKDVLKVGEDQKVILKIDGTEVTLASSLEDVLRATGSTPLFYIIDTGDSYRVVVYMPDAEDKDLELSVTDSEGIGDVDEETDDNWLYILLAAVVVILVVIILMSMARNRGRSEEYEE